MTTTPLFRPAPLAASGDRGPHAPPAAGSPAADGALSDDALDDVVGGLARAWFGPGHDATAHTRSDDAARA